MRRRRKHSRDTENKKSAEALLRGVFGLRGSGRRKYLQEAYKVYSGQKLSSVVAHIAEDIQKQTGYPKDVVVKRAFFDKISTDHPELSKARFFEFVRTLNFDNVDIYHYPLEQKLKFLESLRMKLYISYPSAWTLLKDK